jgi:hypothetical protein
MRNLTPPSLICNIVGLQRGNSKKNGSELPIWCRSMKERSVARPCVWLPLEYIGISVLSHAPISSDQDRGLLQFRACPTVEQDNPKQRIRCLVITVQVNWVADPVLSDGCWNHRLPLLVNIALCPSLQRALTMYSLDPSKSTEKWKGLHYVYPLGAGSGKHRANHIMCKLPFPRFCNAPWKSASYENSPSEQSKGASFLLPLEVLKQFST